MLCASSGHDLLKDYSKHDILKDYTKQWKSDQHWKSSSDTGSGPERDTRWKTDGTSTRNIDTSSWVNDIRGTEQEKRVEQALNLDLNNLSEKQLVDIFSVVTDEPECKAQKYIYDSHNNLILAFQTYFDNHSKRGSDPPSSSASTHHPPFDSPSRSDHYTPDRYPSKECSGFTPDCTNYTDTECSGSSYSTPVKRANRPQRDSFSKDCDHRCCMVHADACCSCSDSRPERELYDIFIKDEGYCITPYRWLFYCPVCKRRTQADSPPQRSSGSYAPLYRPKVRQRTCSKHRICPSSCNKAKDTCVIC